MMVDAWRNSCLFYLTVALAVVFSSVLPALADDRPNILLIVADDLAYSDLGAYGGEIETPVLDALAEEGLQFTNFYVLPTCSPTRSALMSGNTNHVAGMGVMAEFIYSEIEGRAGYEGYLSDQIAALPEILRDAGYHTYMAGKWHLGSSDERAPFRRGFEQTFALMDGGGSHWADMHPLTPLEPMIYRRNGERIDMLPADFYSTRNYTDELISFIDADRNSNKPFFAYLSYTAPHDPLHAPEEYVRKYAGRYDKGWNELLAARVDALQEIGVIPKPLVIPSNFLAQDWTSLTEDSQKLFARDMEVYAAMVDYMDMSIGRLLNYLRDIEEYENTVIVFMSDNGPNGAHATAYPGNADGEFLGTFDNSLENRGLPGSFIDMGPGWARATAAPFRFFKSFTSEGGIRAPLIVSHPYSQNENNGLVPAFVHVTDLLPTFLEMAEAQYPSSQNGREVIPPIGTSLMPILAGSANSMRFGDGIGYELFEMKAFIEDGWKISRMPAPFGTGNWELFDLRTDPGETSNLAVDAPERLTDLVSKWETFAAENGVFDHKGHFDEIYRRIYGTGD